MVTKENYKNLSKINNLTEFEKKAVEIVILHNVPQEDINEALRDYKREIIDYSRFYRETFDIFQGGVINLIITYKKFENFFIFEGLNSPWATMRNRCLARAGRNLELLKIF
jgi:hypothetical protein